MQRERGWERGNGHGEQAAGQPEKQIGIALGVIQCHNITASDSK